MELYGRGRALYNHPGLKGWTLRVSREPRKDEVTTYVGLIYFGEVFHCRIVVASPEGRSEALAELNRQFEDWVYEHVTREQSGDTEPGQP